MDPISFPSFLPLEFPSQNGWELKPTGSLQISQIEYFITNFGADFNNLIRRRDQITNLYGLEQQFHTVQKMYDLVKHVLDNTISLTNSPFMKEMYRIEYQLLDEKDFLLDTLAKKVANVFSRAELESLKTGESLLGLATDQKEPTAFKKLLEAGIPIDARDQYGETALMKACRKHTVEFAATLIAAGANISAQNLKGETALYIAIDNFGFAFSPEDAKQRYNIIAFLLKQGASITIYDKSHTSPLEEAFIQDLPPTLIFQFLAQQKGPLQFEKRPLMQFIPLMQALEKRKRAQDLQSQIEWDDVVCRLLDLGASPNRGSNGVMPLDLAMEGCACRLIPALIAKGATLTLAHFYALYPHFIELCMKGLEARPQDLSNIDGKHNSLLHIAALIHNYEGIVAILTSPFASPDFINLQNGKGQTALMLAEADEIHNDILNLIFIYHGARLDTIDREGNTLLHFAAKHFCTQITNKILEQPFATREFINLRNVNGQSAICSAARSRMSYDNTFQKLIEKGARLDIIDEENNTLLHHAAVGGSDWLIKKILEQPFVTKEFINMRNKRNQTALELIRANANVWITYDNLGKCQELVQLFKNHGADESVAMEPEEKKENPPKKNARKLDAIAAHDDEKTSITAQLANLQLKPHKRQKIEKK